MINVSPIALTIIGFILAVLAFFLITRQLESAFFWSILIGPALGSSLINFLLQALSGDLESAISSLQYMPFFIAAIDKSFFGSDVSGGFEVLGLVILFLWFYVIAHYATHKFGVWGIPIVPIVIFVAGLTLVNLRSRIATTYPFLTFLVEPFMGIPLLMLISGPLFFLSYLAWRRGRTQISLPLSQRLKGF